MGQFQLKQVGQYALKRLGQYRLKQVGQFTPKWVGQYGVRLSAAIRKSRNEYYQILERTQQGSLDITAWLRWFLESLDSALQDTDQVIGEVLKKAKFWQNHSQTIFNERQKLMVNKLMDGEFFGNLTSSKWAKMTKTSQDTANRDINDLLEKGVLRKGEEGGRSTKYLLS